MTTVSHESLTVRRQVHVNIVNGLFRQKLVALVRPGRAGESSCAREKKRNYQPDENSWGKPTGSSIGRMWSTPRSAEARIADGIYIRPMSV
jgi:hypothetical protein